MLGPAWTSVRRFAFTACLTFLVSSLAGCTQQGCSNDSWIAEWQNPGLWEALPTDNSSHPDWRVDVRGSHRSVFQADDGYWVRFESYHLQAQGTNIDDSRFSVFRSHDGSPVSRSRALAEFEEAVGEFGLREELSVDAPPLMAFSSCDVDRVWPSGA